MTILLFATYFGRVTDHGYPMRLMVCTVIGPTYRCSEFLVDGTSGVEREEGNGCNSRPGSTTTGDCPARVKVPQSR